MVIGRRRIGKTTLLRKSAEDGNQPLLYLYVSKDNERVLTCKFQEAAEQALGLQIFGHLETFDQYSGLVLEQYFRQKWMEEERVTLVGNYWDRKGVNDIDMIALNDIDKTAVVAEVKRQRKKLNPSELADIVSSISKKLAKYEVRQIGLTLEDM